MAKYIDAEKLKAEIEKRMDKHWANLPDADSPEDDWTHNELCELGAYKELEHIESLLDSLQKELEHIESIIDSLQQEQPDKGLVEEVKRYYSDNFAYISSDQPTLSILTNIARHFAQWGAEWQKSQMLKGAVEGYVNYYEDSGGKLMAEAQVGCPYHIGDKVHIIVLKKDDRVWWQ